MELKISQSKKKWRKGGMRYTAEFFWNILLCLGSIIVVLGIVFGLFFFSDMNKAFNTEEGGESRGQPVTRPRINKALERFSSREAKMNEILNRTEAIVDPSR